MKKCRKILIVRSQSRRSYESSKRFMIKQELMNESVQEIKKFMQFQKNGGFKVQNQRVLKEYLQVQEIVDRTEKQMLRQEEQSSKFQEQIRNLKAQMEDQKKEVESLNMNYDLEVLKMKKQEAMKIQFTAQKEQIVQKIEENMQQIDNNVKRRITDTKRKIQAIKKGTQSASQLSENKIKENFKIISEMSKKISDLTDSLDNKCGIASQQKKLMEQIVIHQGELGKNFVFDERKFMEAIEENLQDDGATLHEINEEDKSNDEIAKQLLKELQLEKNQSPQLKKVKITDEKEKEDLYTAVKNVNNYIMIENNSQSLDTNIGQLAPKLEKQEEIEEEIKFDQSERNDEPVVVKTEEDLKPLFITQQPNFNYEEVKTENKKAISNKELGFGNPLEKMVQNAKPRNHNAMMTSNENAMRSFSFQTRKESKDKMGNDQLQEERKEEISSQNKLSSDYLVQDLTVSNKVSSEYLMKEDNEPIHHKFHQLSAVIEERTEVQEENNANMNVSDTSSYYNFAETQQY